MDILNRIRALFNKEETIEKSSDAVQVTQVGLTLSSHQSQVTSPTVEQVSTVINESINAYDAFFQLDWLDESGKHSSLYGIGFGTTYHLEYQAMEMTDNSVYVKAGVSLADTQTIAQQFMTTHRVSLDALWQLQKEE